MSKKTILSMIVLLSLAFSSCATVSELIQTYVQKPEVTLEEVSLKDASLLEATLVFQYRISNPNPIGVTLDNLDYTLTFNQKEFVKGTLNQGIRIAASGSEMVQLPITVNYLELFQSVQEFVKADIIDYHIFGSVTIGPVSIPYTKKGQFNVPKVPKITMNQVRLSKISLMGASIIFSLELTNTNPFAIAIDGLDYRIKLGDTPFAQGSASSAASLSERGETTIDIPLNVSFLQLGQSAYKLLTKGSTAYEISGEMKLNIPDVGIKSFPFQKTGEVLIGK